MRALPGHVQSSLLTARGRTSQSTNASLLDSAIASLFVDEDESLDEVANTVGIPLHKAITSTMTGMDLNEALENTKPPQEIVNMVKAPPAKFDKKAVEKAVGILNDKIEKAQLRLDTKAIEIDEFRRKNRKTYKQVQADIVRLASELANYDRLKVKNMANTAGAGKEAQWTNEQKQSEGVSFEEERARDEPVLAMRKKDLEVAQYLLELTRCKDDGKKEKKEALLQEAQGTGTDFSGLRGESGLTGVQVCEDTNQTIQYQFEDPRLDNSSSHLSERGQQMLRAVLRASELADPKIATASVLGAGFGMADLDDGDDDEQLSLLAAVAPPKNKGKQGKRCANAKPDCGVLHDTFAMLWGEMKDLVEELSDKMAKDKAKWESLDASFNDQLGEFTEQQGSLGSALGEIVGETNSALEEQGKRRKTAKQLQEVYEKTMREGKAAMREILYTEICGVIRVRNELLKNSLEITEEEIIDCAMTKWRRDTCSKACDDALAGGTQKLSREVVVKQKGYGAGCPPSTMTTKCGQFPCPVDCKLGEFSRFSKCTKQCGGGVQMRIRSLVVKPKNGGKACEPLQESRPCNSGSCDQSCQLSDWTPWSACSQACGGGFQDKRRKVLTPARAGGSCPKYGDARRFLREPCNSQKCVGDEVCIAKVDVVLAIDGSGSLTQKGFDILKKFTSQLAETFRNTAYGNSAATIGAVHFGNGHLEEGIVSDAEIVHPLTSHFENVTTAVQEMKFSRGFTNMAQGIMKAQKMLKSSPRKDAESIIVLITDGKPSFKRQTNQAVEEFRKMGKLVVIQVKSFPTEADSKLMQSYVSSPTRGNYLMVPGKKALKSDYKNFVTQALVHICPRAVSPSSETVESKSRGFRLLYEGKVCALWPGPNATLQESVEACHAHAASLGEWTTFQFMKPDPPLSAATPELPMGAVPLGKCKVFQKSCDTYLDYAKVDVYAPPSEQGEQEGEQEIEDEFEMFEG